MKKHTATNEQSGITLDFTHVMGKPEDGFLTTRDINAMEETIQKIHNVLLEKKANNTLGFYDLYTRNTMIDEVETMAKKLAPTCENLVVLGIGGSALGTIAVHRALNPWHYNLLPENSRKGPRLFIMDNIDPETLGSLLEFLNPEKTIINVISKSGSTAETMSQFLIARKWLMDNLGQTFNRHIVITTDPESGFLRKIAQMENFATLPIPADIGGRFSVFTPVGLFPLAMTGIDIRKLLAGCKAAAQTCTLPEVWKNPAYLSGIIHYIFEKKQGLKLWVMMPYSDSLKEISDWYTQLSAESLGKRFDIHGKEVFCGPTPIKALGATDQHSQLQLYMEGPRDKIFTFIEVETFRNNDITIPKAYEDIEGVEYLGGHTLGELLNTELRATRLALRTNKRPSITFRFPEINAWTIGQLIYILEVQVVFLGHLYQINPLDQPGVELGKQLTYGLMGRSGFEKSLKDVKQAESSALKQYVKTTLQ